MKMKFNASNDSKVLILCFILLVVIAISDFLAPLGVAGGVPYIIVILTAVWLHDNRYVGFFSVVASVLIIIGFYLSPEGGELWKVIANRGLAFFAVWTTALLVILRENSRAELVKAWHDAEVQKEKQAVYYATIHGAQHITNNLLNQLTLIENEISDHPDFDQDVVSMFHQMMKESSNLIDRLSSVEKMDAEIIKQSIESR